jgi:hypothetical protein
METTMHVSRIHATAAAGVFGLLTACAGGGSNGPSDPSTAPASLALLTWKPGLGDTCPVEVHNRYAAVGPDGKAYPTWHPPVDPASGCTFGHEHGRDPSGSDLYASVGPLPFGYANEVLDAWDPNGRRHEDHVGHKVEWENDIQMNIGGVAGQVLDIRCDVLVKLHQGTHSKDAFTNNVHELIYHIRCTEGTEMHVTLMAAIGRPGEFTRTCDGTRIAVGTATPANSPVGGGQRKIPDRFCVDQHVLVGPGQTSSFKSGLHESWETHSTIRTEEGRSIASFDPYFQVDFPSRFHDPALGDLTGKVIDLCYATEANGDQARGGGCQTVTDNGAIPGITQTDPRSPFNGVLRAVDINSNRVDNAEGPEVWYTDPFGRNARTTSFAGSIRQTIARVNNTGAGFGGPTIGRNRHYGGAGVHAPN